MKEAFTLQFKGNPDGLKEAEEFCALCLAEYQKKTGIVINGDKWCELALERRTPDGEIIKLDYYEVPVDKFSEDSGVDELRKREKKETLRADAAEAALAQQVLETENLKTQMIATDIKIEPLEETNG